MSCTMGLMFLPVWRADNLDSSSESDVYDDDNMKLLKLHLNLCDPRVVNDHVQGQHSDSQGNAVFLGEA